MSAPSIIHRCPRSRRRPAKTFLAAAAAAVLVVLGVASAGGAAGGTPTMVVWGDNSNQQLSYTAPGRSVIPTPVQGGVGKCDTASLGQAGAVAGGGFHTLALTKPGTPNGGFVCGWGHQFYGQLGRGTFGGSPVNVPFPVCKPTTPISGVCQNAALIYLSGVTAIGAGGFHSMALLGANNTMGLAPGTVVTWGQNNNGELGNGSTANSSAPVAVCLAACTATGPFLSGAVAISAGLYFNLALLGAPNSMGLPAGSVVAWGDNTYGELGLGNNTASPQSCVPGPRRPRTARSSPCRCRASTRAAAAGPTAPARSARAPCSESSRSPRGRARASPSCAAATSAPGATTPSGSSASRTTARSRRARTAA